VFCLKSLLEHSVCVDLRRTTSRHPLLNTTVRSTSASNHSPAAAPHTRNPILSYSLKVTPSNHFVNWQQDPQGKLAGAVCLSREGTELKVEVDFTAQMTVINPFDFFVEPYADSFPFDYTSDLKTELAPISRPSSPGRSLPPILPGFRARRRARSISWSISMRDCKRRFATSFAWSPASRRRSRRWRRARDRAATRHGC